MASSGSVHSDSEDDDVGVELGFVKALPYEENWRLHRCYFPSKVGGRPSWLDPKNIPTPDDVKCSVCDKTMSFLLQIYAPNDDHDSTFHRTIYLFCCKTPNCYNHHSSRPFKVLRCQLPQNNEFYDIEPPDYDSPQYYKSCKDFAKICGLCGFAANKTCSRCHKVSYCCKEHQTVHWIFHKVVCGKEFDDDRARKLAASFSDFLFPEYEIEMENEECSVQPDETLSSNDVLNVSNGKFPDGLRSPNGKFSTQELEQFANVNPSEKEFLSFRKATLTSPDQILRYDKGGAPLWCSGENRLLKDEVPNCSCGAMRLFEFQVMPQLLYHLDIQNNINDPSIDWGILAVYTCSADCNPEDHFYHSEYLHKQDFGTLDQAT